MVTWGEFRDAEPAIADAGSALFYFLDEPEVGLGILGTTRLDGGPRVHPCCPMIMGGRLFAFLIPSPKRDDLHRDGRYALHCYPPKDNEDAFYITGKAVIVTDKAVVASAKAQYLAERRWETPPLDFDQQELFELLIERVLLTRTNGHGDFNPRHSIWKAPTR